APNGIELHSVLNLVFNPTSDFAISASPTAVSAAPGTSATTTVSTSTSGSFNSAISLSASGLPAGASAAFSPTSIAAPGNGSSTLTRAAGTAAAGTYTVTVTGTGGGKTHSTPVSFTVSSGGGAQQLLQNPGFESGNTVWVATANVITNSSSEPAHGGSWK